jgi:hypothetical protein
MSGHVWLNSWSLAVSPLPQKQPQSVKQTPTTTHYHYRENHASSKTWDFCPSMIFIMVLTSPFFLSDTHWIGKSLTNVVKPSKKHWVILPSAPSGVYLDGDSAGPSEDTHGSIPRSKPL